MMKKKTRAEKEKRGKGEREIFSFSKLFAFSSIALMVLLSLGCQPNQTILKDVAHSPTPLATVETKKTTLEEDLREMETAGFDYVFVFRRKDGGLFDEEDRKYLRQNTPIETNRWKASVDGKSFIAGSGFSFTPEQMEALRKRFIVEDYSKPEVKEAANNTANTNANKTEKPKANK